MDLFTPVVEDAKLHPNFKRILNTSLPGELQVLNDWANGFVDRDGKFVKEFQTTFNSSYWELYLYACFKEFGFTADFSHPAPDFCLVREQHQLIAEAVIASHAAGYRPEWERGIDLEGGRDIDVAKIVHLSSIRLSNAITSKHRKYVAEYGCMEHVEGKPFVVCVAPFEQPFYYIQNDHALRRVLYAYDQPLWFIRPGTGERVVTGESLLEQVDKDSGATIALGLFTNDHMKEISAVVFSNTAGWCKVRAQSSELGAHIIFSALRYQAEELWPQLVTAWKKKYHESLIDGLHVCMNPFASIPFDAELFRRPDVAIHTYDPDSQTYAVDSQDGFLIQRSCMQLRSAEGVQQPEPGSEPPGGYRELSREPWPDGELRPGFGHVPPFVDTHLAHYQGWTAVVAFDEIDSDWMAQALRGCYFTTTEYRDANARDEIPVTWAEGGFPTKEDALREVIERIEGFEQELANGD